MSFDAAAVADEVLSSAAEDWLGLYEVVWSLNTLQPMVTVTDKYAAAEEAVRSLLRSGSVSLYRLPWQEPSAVAELVETGEVEAVLANPLSWSPNLGTDPPTYIGLATTEEGERELARRAVGGPKEGE